MLTRRLGAGVIGLLVSLAAIAFLASVIDLRATVEVLGGTHLGWLAATLLMVPAQVLLRSQRWRLLLPRRPDGERPALRRVTPVLLVGQLANLVLPVKLGEPVRAYLMARREQLSLVRVFGSVLLERVIDMASLAPLAVLAALMVGAPGWMVSGAGLLALAGVILMLLLVASAVPRAIRLVSRTGGPATRLRWVGRTLTTLGEGASGSGRPALALAIGLSTVTWFFVAGTFWLLGVSLDLGIDPVGAMLIATVATLGTAIPSAPASIGTFELATVAAAGALGVSGEHALALALLAHAVTTLPFAAAGMGAVAWMSISLGQMANEATAAWPDSGAARERSA